MARTFHPLATVGDTVTSFMERPDPSTVACGPLSLATVVKMSSKKDESYSQKIKNWKGLMSGGERGEHGHTLLAPGFASPSLACKLLPPSPPTRALLTTNLKAIRRLGCNNSSSLTRLD